MKQEATQGRQYLTFEEETAVVKFLLMKSELGHSVRIKFLPSIAFSVARQRSSLKKPNKRPGQKWARCFTKRHPNIRARTVKPVDWKRREQYTYGKMAQWFEVIAKVLQDPAVELKPELGKRVMILYLYPWLYYIAHWCYRTNVLA